MLVDIFVRWYQWENVSTLWAMVEIPVLFQDSHIVVVHKPAGLLVHRGMGAAREDFLMQLVRDLVGGFVYPVHRLDRPTSGLVVFGKSSEAAHLLQESWQRGLVCKSYQAIARGWMPAASGLRDEALDDPDSGILQEARTRWVELERLEVDIAVGKYSSMRCCFVELEPLTGRWHQLRRHFSRMQHPLLGDTTHGDRHHNHALQERLGWWRLLLHAQRLEFPHPFSKEKMIFSDEIERGLRPWWQALAMLSGDSRKR